MATASATDASDTMTEAELEAATAPETAPGTIPAAKDGSALVSQVEYDRRRAAGLPEAFDPDDDDTDENLEEVEAKAGDKSDPEKDAEAKVDEDDESAADEGEKPEEKAESEKEESEVDPVLSALHERAKACGLDATKISDRVALEASVAAVERMLHDVGTAEIEAAEAEVKRSAEEPGNRDDAPAETEIEAEADPADKKKPQFDGTGKKIKFKLDELNREDYAPELIEALDEMRNVIVDLRAGREADRNALKAEREKSEAVQKKQQAEREEIEIREATRRVDGYFAALAKESTVWKDLFGDAPVAELLKTDEGKKLFKNRNEALRAGDAYVEGRRSRKLPTEAEEASFKAGVRLAFGEKYAEAAAKKLAEKVTKRRDSDVPRPNSSRSAPVKGGALRATLKKHNMPIQDEG